MKPPALPDIILEPIVQMALAEDLGRAGDVTSRATISPVAIADWRINTRQAGVVAGLDVAAYALRRLDPSAIFAHKVADGDHVQAGDTLAHVRGRAQSLLAAERVMLNFIGHLSGIATLTSAFVTEVAGTGARIAATRKTIPGLRALAKQAVILGGGTPHRYGLDDAMLIKDNHIAAAGGITAAITSAKAQAGHLMAIEIEVDSLTQLDEALPFAPTCILLDNFSLDDLRIAVARVQGKVVLEASGGVSLSTVRAIAQTGVDIISVGAITHSAPCLDVGLDA